ncbi:MAG: aldehyde dehydrogenase family protein [Deltaproteobacteria bacterium]|nr:aldehyde dehydrogenase family protein [Deltaproteobacteria bacterium]
MSRALVDGRWLEVPTNASWDVMDQAIAAASRAFAAWSSTPREERRRSLACVADRVHDEAERLADAMAREVGKPITMARAEVTRLELTFRLAADFLAAPAREEVPLDYDPRGASYRCFVERIGVGPVLAIVPYNWPYNLAAHKLAPALAAGNTVVLKPSPLAMISTLALVALVDACGLPPGVLNAVGCAEDVAERAVADPRIKAVSFTGSERVGFRVREVARDKPVVLELGGDASALVFPDADLEWAASRIAASAFGYAGQVCISAQHARVHAAILPAFRERLLAATLATPMGDPLEATTVCGPMIHEDAARKAIDWIEEAVALGARLLAGGRRDGRLVEPTLLEDVPRNARLATEEAFAPVVCLSSFADTEDAFAAVNASRFGLHVSVFTRDEALVERAFRELEVGGVVVDEFPTLRFDAMPYGGVKRSGVGREGIRYAFDELSVPKVLLERRPVIQK